MKYIVAGIAFISIWFASYFLIGLVSVFIIRPKRPVMRGVGPEWINLHGTIFGFLAGLHSAKETIRRANARAGKKE